jgi:hypothetical protein
MEVTYSTEKPVDFQRTTSLYIPEDRTLQDVLRYHLQNYLKIHTRTRNRQNCKIIVACSTPAFRRVLISSRSKCKPRKVLEISRGIRMNNYYFYRNTRCHIPADSSLHKDRCDNLKPNKVTILFVHFSLYVFK